MSFPRAKITRFNDVQNITPAVGSYNPQLQVHTPSTKFGLPARSRSALSTPSSSVSSTPDCSFKIPHTPGSRAERNVKLKLDLQSSTENLSEMQSAFERELAGASELPCINCSKFQDDLEQAIISRVDLEQKLKMMEESVLEVTQQRSDLEQLAVDVKQQAEVLKSALAERESEKCELAGRLADVMRERDYLLSKCDKFEQVSKAATKLESVNEELTCKLESIQHNMNEVTQEKNGLALMLEELEVEKAVLKENLDKSEALIASLTQKNSQQTFELKSEITKNKHLDECLIEEHKKVALLQSQLETGASEVALLISDQKELKEKLTYVEEDRNLHSMESTKLSSQVAELLSEKQHLDRKLHDAEEISVLLQAEINKVSAELKAELSNKNEMEQTLASLKLEANELHNMVHQGETSVTELEACKKDLEQKLVAADKQLAEAFKDLSELSANFETMKNDNESLSRKLRAAELNAASFSSVNSELLAKLNDAKEKSDELQECLAQKDAEITEMSLELISEIDRMKTFQRELEQQLLSAEDSRNVLCKDVEELMGEVEVLTDEKSLLSTKVSDACIEIASMKEDVGKLHSNLEDAEKRASDSEVARRNLEEQLIERTTRIRELDDRQSQLSGTIAMLEREAALHCEKLQENEKGLVTLSEKNRLLLDDLKAEQALSAAYKESVVKQCNKALQLQSELASVTATAAYERKNLKRSVDEAIKTVEELRLANSKLVNNEKSLLDDKQQVVRQLQEALAESANLQMQLNEACEILNIEKAERNKLEVEMGRLKESTAKLQMMLQETCANLTGSEMQLAQLQGKMESAESMIALLRQEKECTSEQLKVAQHETATAAQKLKELEQNIIALMSEKDLLTSKLDSEQEECNTLKALLLEKDSKTLELESQLSHFSVEAAAKEQLCNAMKQKIECLAATNEELKRDNNKTAGQVVTLQVELQNANACAQVEKTKRTELEANLKESQARGAVLESHLQDIANKANALHACKVNLSEQVACLQQQLVHAKEDCNNMHLEVRELKQSLEQLSSSNVENERHVKKYTTVCQHLDKENRHLSDELKKLKEVKEECISDMKLRLRKAEADGEKWQKAYELLMAKVGPFEEQLNMYQLEKQALEEQNEATTSQLSEVCSKYAKLLGHQNHRQKIHYVDKLAQQNLQMKQELFKLREQTQVQRVQIGKLEIELVRATGKRHGNELKENIHPAS
ncbi:hyaluronan mediated motility receptor-like [Ornithodoros turicata]